MIKIALIYLIAFGLSQTTMASEDLNGTWKIERWECKSGAPHQAYTGGFSGSSSGQITFKDSSFSGFLNVQIKYDEAQGQALLKQIDDSKKQVEQMPDFEGKQKYLADIENSKASILAIIEKYKDGVSCRLDAQGTYSVNGSAISLKTDTLNSTCENASMDSSGSRYEVSGNTLSVTSQPETEDGKACPKGDSRVTILSRVQ